MAALTLRYRVYLALGQVSPATAQEVAVFMKVDVKSIHSTLHDLAKIDAAEKLSDGKHPRWRAIPSATVPMHAANYVADRPGMGFSTEAAKDLARALGY